MGTLKAMMCDIPGSLSLAESEPPWGPRTRSHGTAQAPIRAPWVRSTVASLHRTDHPEAQIDPDERLRAIAAIAGELIRGSAELRVVVGVCDCTTFGLDACVAKPATALPAARAMVALFMALPVNAGWRVVAGQRGGKEGSRAWRLGSGSI
jgi:hypothetical protein